MTKFWFFYRKNIEKILTNDKILNFFLYQILKFFPKKFNNAKNVLKITKTTKFWLPSNGKKSKK